MSSMRRLIGDAPAFTSIVRHAVAEGELDAVKAMLE
jgi:hypothetical protein